MLEKIKLKQPRKHKQTHFSFEKTEEGETEERVESTNLDWLLAEENRDLFEKHTKLVKERSEKGEHIRPSTRKFIREVIKSASLEKDLSLSDEEIKRLEEENHTELLHFTTVIVDQENIRMKLKVHEVSEINIEDQNPANTRRRKSYKREDRRGAFIERSNPDN